MWKLLKWVNLREYFEVFEKKLIRKKIHRQNED